MTSTLHTGTNEHNWGPYKSIIVEGNRLLYNIVLWMAQDIFNSPDDAR